MRAALHLQEDCLRRLPFPGHTLDQFIFDR